MKKLLILTLALIFILNGCTNKETTTQPIQPGGRLYLTGDVKVAVLEGTWKDMGQQLGNLLRADITELYGLMVQSQINLGLYDFGELLSEANRRWDNILPSWLKALSTGLAVSTSLSLDEIKILQIFQIFSHDSSEGSGIITWGGYTDGGSVLMGYNLDKIFDYSYAHLMCVMVFKPDDAPHNFAVFGFPGIFNAASGVNDAGLCIARIDAPMADVFTGRNTSILRRDVRSWEWLMTYSTVNQLRVAYLAAPVAIGGNCLVADLVGGACFETALDRIVERTLDASGLICETNHFVSPFLQSHNQSYFGGDTITDSHTRRTNLLRLAEENRPDLTISELMNSIMLLPFERGGVEINSVISFALRSGDQMLIIRSPDRINTEVIDLKKYFD